MTPATTSGDPWPQMLVALAQSWPPMRWRDLGVVVGCSGGADSVGLLRAMCQLRDWPGDQGSQPPRGFLVAAHFNHALRGAESDADEAFVSALARDCGIRFATGRSSDLHRDEAAMRNERVRFLSETADEMGARYIALAHTADDNVETVLHHFVRGTGPAGLSGIGNPRPIGDDLVLIRPLLQVRRSLIRDALESLGQPWREDSSNDNTDYRRNWIRHRLIPLIETEFPCAVDAVGRAVDGQREWRDLIDRLAHDWLAKHRGDNPLVLQRDPSVESPIVVTAAQTLWRERDWPRGEMTREHWRRLAATLQGQANERYTLPGGIDVSAKNDVVQFGGRK